MDREGGERGKEGWTERGEKEIGTQRCRTGGGGGGGGRGEKEGNKLKLIKVSAIAGICLSKVHLTVSF